MLSGFFSCTLCRSGIQITGSHNPPDYNGFKMMLGKKSFFGEEIQKLGAMAGKGAPGVDKVGVGTSTRVPGGCPPESATLSLA